MTAASRLLRFRGVGRVFGTPAGPVHALRRADLDLAAGEFVAVTGRSGAGKTTLLNIAATLDRPSYGLAEYRGVEASRFDERARSEYRKHAIGIVFQGDMLLPSRNAYENVLFRFRYTGVSRRDAGIAAGRALERVGLSALAARAARELSGGEARRVAIARAIAVEPALLIADEPTANLDAETARGVIDCFEEVNDAGIAVLLVTHDRDMVPERARCISCNDGVAAGCEA